ncbi:MAG TPA: hypothetical protein VI300_12880, partial [Solirubrobacter sp.]
MTPEEQIAALEGVPVTLLPVRLETRYVGAELRIRVYPDQVHLDAHVPALADGEIAAGQLYWRTRWSLPAGDQRIARAWEQLTRGLRPPRAAWIVRSLTPTNALGDPAGPQFPAVTRRDAGLDLPLVTRALPTRWIAVGFDAAGTQVLRRWFDNPIPDGLLATASLTSGPDLTGDAAVDAYLGWASNYAQAVAAGMALTVTAADLPAPHTLAEGFERLVVLGVDLTQGAAGGAKELEALLAAHAVSDGLGFLAPGTPTNTTTEDGDAALVVADPARPATPSDPAWSAGPRLAGALGL